MLSKLRLPAKAAKPQVTSELQRGELGRREEACSLQTLSGCGHAATSGGSPVSALQGKEAAPSLGTEVHVPAGGRAMAQPGESYSFHSSTVRTPRLSMLFKILDRKMNSAGSKTKSTKVHRRFVPLSWPRLPSWSQL